MLVFPNSKINLGLYVTGKRPDGYHNIETVFFPVPLNDAVEILPLKEREGRKVYFTNTGIPVDCDEEKNLCLKAYNLLDRDFNLPAIELILHKAVPMGAGLGGGSSDGAFTLLLLNRTFRIGLSKEQLAHYASKLGSDCAFFIYNTPMLGTGRGELLSPVEVDLKSYHLILVKPHTFVSTAEAYKEVRFGRPALPLPLIVNKPVEEWKNYLKNSFEENVFQNHPNIGDIKDSLYSQGAVYASMSGSGSTVYGIFNEEINLKDLFPGCFYWMGKMG